MSLYSMFDRDFVHYLTGPNSISVKQVITRYLYNPSTMAQYLQERGEEGGTTECAA